MTSATMIKPQAKTSYNFVDSPLNILLSCRIRLNDEQRGKLKAAYNKLRFGGNTSKSTTPGSNLTTTTATDSATDFYKTTRMNAVVVGDLLGTRESISLPIVLTLSRALGVSIITEKEIIEAAKGYATYVFNEMDLG